MSVSSSDNFNPVTSFTWDINRAERSRQVRWLAPLLDATEGRVWFLRKLECPCSDTEAAAAEVFHLCFPLRDLFTADYYQCRGHREREDAFIRYYNCLLGLPVDFGIEAVWRTAPGGDIRHPAAPGRKGWNREFLIARLADERLCDAAIAARQALDTEADVLILTESVALLVECKFQSNVKNEQYGRHMLMGNALASDWVSDFISGWWWKDDAIRISPKSTPRMYCGLRLKQ